MRVSSILILSAVLAATIALVGCNESGTGILYSIRNETAYEDLTLDNGLTVSGFFPLSGSYYAVTGTLYARNSSSDTEQWLAIDPPAANMLVTSAAPLGTLVYAVATSIVGDVSSLYAYDPSAGTWSSAIDIDGDGTAEQTVTSVVPGAPGSLVVNLAASTTVYASYTTADGSTFSVVTLPATSAPIEAMTSFGGDLWVVAGGILYTNGGGSFAAVSATNSPSADTTGVVDLYSYTDLGALLVVCRDGTLYALVGTTWLAPVETFSSDVSSTAATTVFGVTLSSGDRVVLVGTNAGYLELAYTGTLDSTAFAASTVSVPGEASVSTSGSDYSVVELRRSVVLDFAVSDSRLFVGTGGAGLWRTAYDSATRKWNRE